MKLAGTIISRFPCCRGVKFNKLTMAQAAVVELIANLEDGACEFNLNHALSVWSKADVEVFWEVVREAYQRQVENGVLMF